MQHFHHPRQRQRVDVLAGLHQQGWKNGQGQWHADQETAAAAQFGLNLDLPAEFADA
ncbi:hypothetical protein D3C71_2248640 [compost metagenome]